MGADSWSKDYSKRTISAFTELLDVSAVTYPASPTTSIALAGNNGVTSLDAGRRNPNMTPRLAAVILQHRLRAGLPVTGFNPWLLPSHSKTRNLTVAQAVTARSGLETR